MGEFAVLLPIVLLLLWNWWEDREYERRRTQPERAKRRMRDLEHQMLMAMNAEDLLRRMLIEDLRQIAAQRRAVQYLRDEYNMEIEWPILTSSSAKTGRFTWEKFVARWGGRSC